MDLNWTAIAGLAGIAIGASLTSFFARRTNETKHYLELGTQAYVDFMKSTAALAIAQKNKNVEKEFDATAQLADAKARICIYGSAGVIKDLAAFWRNGAQLDSPERYSAFVRLAQAMRKSGIMMKQPVPNADIAQLLVGSDVTNE